MSNHAEVAHRWFHQIGNRRTGYNSYESGNMFYEHSLIYSYGRHFLIAARFEDKIIFNSKSYSNSTTKHQNHVSGAIDYGTHTTTYLPLLPFSTVVRFDYNDYKQWYKAIDFKSFVSRFETAKKKLGRARKPEIYLEQIKRIQDQLTDIFTEFRGSKTLALKEKGMRSLLNFEFSEGTLQKLREKVRKDKEARRKELAAQERENKRKLREWVNGGHYAPPRSQYTFIRVREDVLQTSKGMRVPLADAVRVFKLWQAGKALGVEIKTTQGHTFKCSKANGIIKFGCHEIEKAHAEMVLKPYL